MTLTSLTPDCSPQIVTMPPYQQQPAGPQSWGRWQQPQAAGPEYSMMGGIVPFDPRAVSSTAALQPATLAPQYSLPTSYASSPVTPVSASSYGSQSHFANYQSYAYQTPTSAAAAAFTQMPVQTPLRPTAPPTPPLDEERDTRLARGRTASVARGGTDRRAPKRTASTVKYDAGGEPKTSKTCPKYIKTDGSLQFESKKPVDILLRKANELVMRPKSEQKHITATPESIPSPAPEEDTKPKGFKRFGCDICPQRFHQRAQLRTHLRSHTGEKPHECDICGMRVSQPGNLKAHKRKHTQEKPYGCHLCGLRFSSNGGLKVHVRNKHEFAPKQPCPVEGCTKQFSTIGNMKVHIGKFHGKEIESSMKLMENLETFEGLPVKLRTLLETLLRIYKNSNCGIKGRGLAHKMDKTEALQERKRESAPSEMTPVSPASTSTVQEYRSYYDQQHYHGLPCPPQQAQPQAGYLQSVMHQPQHQVYHGLPQPVAYGMSWPQYH